MTVKSCREDQEGSALAITLLLLMGLSALGTVFMTTSRTETQIVGNEIRYSQALYAAEGGLHEAMARLSDVGAGSYVGENMQNPNKGWGLYLVTAAGNSSRDPDYAHTESDGVDNDLDGLIDESGEAYPEVLSAQSALADPIDYPWVRVSYGLDGSGNLIRYGDHDDNPTTRPRKNPVSGSPVVYVTARGERGTAGRTLEVELVKRPGPYVKTCIYSEDDNFKFDGNAFLISGYDHDPATGDSIPGAPGVTAIVTTEDPNNILAAIQSFQEDQVIGPDGEANVEGCSYDLDLEGYVAHYSPYADFRYEGSSTISNVSDWGGMDDFKIVYVKDGDLHLSGNCWGGGLLLVDGSLTITGKFTWYGLIIGLGDIDLSGGGNGIHIYGGILSNGQVTRSDIGGQADIFYSSEMLNKLRELERLLVLSWNER